MKMLTFTGIRPRLPESLLPDGAATIAQNCDFAYGELRNTKGGFLIGSMSNSPRSIYTDDGLTFYTWSTDVNAVRSPISKDEFTRMYYTDGTNMMVANRMGTRISGGEPASPYKVGVPRPTVAPELKVSIPNIFDATKYSLVYKCHWESGGIKYQELTISPQVIPPDKVKFIPPVIVEESTTPATSKPVLRITVTDKVDSSQVADLYSDNSSLESSNGLWTLAIAKDEGDSNIYTVTITASIKESDKETRAVVYTYVNTYGEEGPPSDPTTVSTSPIANMEVVVTLDAVTGYAPIKEIREYRTPSGSTIAEYFYAMSKAVTGQPPGKYTIVDTVKSVNLNEQLASLNYYAPTAGLVGLMSLPNGILCAWKGSELHFSEAYKPWAWPPKYVKTLGHAIVGGIAHGSGAIITTVINPYSVSGVSPDSMTLSRMNVDQAGVSKWSIAVVDGAVSYASNDGLVIISGNSASLIQGQKFFTRDVWRDRYRSGLSGMRFSVWDGRLIVFHGSGSFVPFMIRFDEADGAMTDLPNFVAASAFVSQLSDQCYYSNGNSIYQFNGGSDETTTWQSKEYVIARPGNLAFGQAVATGSWSIEFWAGGVLRHTQAVGSGVTNFRLPSGFTSDRWMIKITGTGRFRELRVAQTGRGLSAL